jgi:hypothetical protein
MWSGYREALWLHNDGETAHNILIGPVEIGDWTLTFEPAIPVPKGPARVLVDSIAKTHSNGGSQQHEQVMRLEDAWMDVSGKKGRLGK